MTETVFKIENHPTDYDLLVVQLVAANQIDFEINFKGLNYQTVIADLCAVAPHMMEYDADLQEAHDNAFRTLPKDRDVLAVRAFFAKYKGRIPDHVRETFFA